MNRDPAPAVRPAQLLAERVFSAIERFLHIQAVSGIVLLLAAAIALGWANSPVGDSYTHFWEMPLTLGFGSFVFAPSLHFVINEVLMTIFFLVVGMEIRREMHDGALSEWRAAALPLAAAVGGVVVPAIIYLSFNTDPVGRAGWAIPTATDIAFAVGVLALLGKGIPFSVRIFLLALAIIDDIVAVIVIALFYSGGLEIMGALIALVGVLFVLGLQSIGIGSAFAYVVPGAIVWLGLLKMGAHPTLAGVVLGLLTPVVPVSMRMKPMDLARRALREVGEKMAATRPDPNEVLMPLKSLRTAHREFLPPVSRVQMALHPWVAYGVMPLFALANAGIVLKGVSLDAPTLGVLLGVAVALVLGKPAGIVAGSWIAVRLGWCQLPPEMNWRAVALVGCLGGIGFTMSIFIAMLAFVDPNRLAAAKLGVLLASLVAGILGIIVGRAYLRGLRQR